MIPSGFFSGHRSNFMYETDPRFVPNNPFGPSFSDPFFQNTWSPFQGHPQHYGAPTHMMNNPSFFHQTTSSSTFSTFQWKETAEGHVLTAELPGMAKEDVKVEAVEDGRVLSVSGDKKMDKEEKSDGWYSVEHSAGNFLRRFRLPEKAVAGGLSTHFENGVLTVTVAKKNDGNVLICGP